MLFIRWAHLTLYNPHTHTRTTNLQIIYTLWMINFPSIIQDQRSHTIFLLCMCMQCLHSFKVDADHQLRSHSSLRTKKENNVVTIKTEFSIIFRFQIRWIRTVVGLHHTVDFFILGSTLRSTATAATTNVANSHKSI